METGLDGRVALITGAGSGIGLASARALAAEGCRVVVADLNPEAAAAELEQEWPGRIEPVTADVAAPADASRTVRAAVDRFGRLDVLVTSAGIWERSGVEALSVDDWDRVIDINLRGTFVIAREAIAAMEVNDWGRVVTLASMAAQTGGDAAGPAYVASKAGVIGLTRSLAKFAGPKGITVNSIAPGLIETPMTSVVPAEDLAAAAARTPVRRNGSPEDVAAVVVMLASEPAGFVTGTCLSVSGGLVMG